jgi:Ca-activated chloride channel homolog
VVERRGSHEIKGDTMKKILGLLSLSVLLFACPIEKDPIPQRATLNGYTFADKAAGKVKFGVSALDDQDQVLLRGQISNPTVSSLQVVSGQNVQPSAIGVSASSASATVCASITADTAGPLACAIILDATGSMKDNDPASVAGDLTSTKRNLAAKQFISRMRPNDKAATASFDATTPATNPYRALFVTQEFTSSRDLLLDGVDLATAESGGTNLWDAVYDASDWLSTQSNSNKIALILTDGNNTAGSTTVTQAYLNAQNKGVKVYMVGLGSSLDAANMERIARETGGLFVTTNQATGLSDLFNGVYNSVQAQGCIQITFSPVPAPGTKVSGKLNFNVNGVALSVDFTVTF